MRNAMVKTEPGSDVSTARSRKRRWGIRARVTALATLIVAVTLILSGVALAVLVRSSLINDLDSTMLARAQGVAALATASGVSGTIPTTANQNSLVQVVDSTGAVIAATSNMRDGDSGFDGPVLSQPPSQRQTTVSTLSDTPLDGSTGQFRVLAEPVTLPTGPGWIYVASTLAQADTAITSVITLFGIGLPLVLLVVGFAVWRAVTKALKPVEEIRSRASTISAADLTQRVPVPRSGDEIARLAETMNEMLDRLEGAAIRQNQFIGDASHELRSPLAGLRAQVEVALVNPDPKEAIRTLGTVHDQVLRMSTLTDDLLFLARSTEAAPKLYSDPVDLDELVLGEVSRLRELDGPTVSLGRLDAARVPGSKRDLARVLRNLTDNARNHAHSHIRIALSNHNGIAELVVDDDGDGIAEDDRERLFERFTRLDDSRVRNISGGGFGLGLAIARQVVVAHGGTLTSHSRADGSHGAEFRVRLPIS